MDYPRNSFKIRVILKPEGLMHQLQTKAFARGKGAKTVSYSAVVFHMSKCKKAYAVVCWWHVNVLIMQAIWINIE